MKQLLILFVFAVAGQVSWSQNVLEISVQDRMSKDPLTHARIIFHTGADSTMQYTNGEGLAYYKLTSDTVDIACSHIAYETTEQHYIRKKTRW